jgi:hypothetical protein
VIRGGHSPRWAAEPEMMMMMMMMMIMMIMMMMMMMMMINQSINKESMGVY